VNNLKQGLNTFSGQNLKLTYVKNLSIESQEISDQIQQDWLKATNLIKILNNKKKLSKLESISDVYNSEVDIIEEVLFYHENKINQPESLYEK
jgi:hypothetical protein